MQDFITTFRFINFGILKCQNPTDAAGDNRHISAGGIRLTLKSESQNFI